MVLSCLLSGLMRIFKRYAIFEFSFFVYFYETFLLHDHTLTLIHRATLMLALQRSQTAPSTALSTPISIIPKRNATSTMLTPILR